MVRVVETVTDHDGEVLHVGADYDLVTVLTPVRVVARLTMRQAVDLLKAICQAIIAADDQRKLMDPEERAES